MVRPYLKNTEQLLQVNWGQTINWDVRFPDAPAPFNAWFPAHVLDRRVVSIERMEIPGPVIKTAIPAGEEPRELTLSFYDDDQDTLRTWLVNWMADISWDGLAIATIKEACKKVFIAHLDHAQKQTSLAALHVWPYGALTENFNSGSANTIKGYTVSFVVAGSDKGARVGFPNDSNVSGDGLVKTITPDNLTPPGSRAAGTLASR